MAVFCPEIFRDRRQTPLPTYILAKPFVMSSEVETCPCTMDGTAAGSLDFARDDFADAPSHLEAFAQIKLPADGVVDEKIFRAFAFDASIVNQIGSVHDGESLAHVVVGDHDG